MAPSFVGWCRACESYGAERFVVPYVRCLDERQQHYPGPASFTGCRPFSCCFAHAEQAAGFVVRYNESSRPKSDGLDLALGNLRINRAGRYVAFFREMAGANVPPFFDFVADVWFAGHSRGLLCGMR